MLNVGKLGKVNQGYQVQFSEKSTNTSTFLLFHRALKHIGILSIKSSTVPIFPTDLFKHPTQACLLPYSNSFTQMFLHFLWCENWSISNIFLFRIFLKYSVKYNSAFQDVVCLLSPLLLLISHGTWNWQVNLLCLP